MLLPDYMGESLLLDVIRIISSNSIVAVIIIIGSSIIIVRVVDYGNADMLMSASDGNKHAYLLMLCAFAYYVHMDVLYADDG